MEIRSSVEELADACSEGNVDKVRRLLGANTEVHRWDWGGTEPQPLAIACSYDKASLDRSSSDDDASDPEARAKSLRMVEMLLAAGADPNVGSEWYDTGYEPGTALRYSVFSLTYQEEHVRLLLAAGADARAMMDEPFLSACIMAFPGILRMLRDRHVEERDGRYKPPTGIWGINRGKMPFADLYRLALDRESRFYLSPFIPVKKVEQENQKRERDGDTDFCSRRADVDTLLRRFLQEEDERNANADAASPVE